MPPRLSDEDKTGYLIQDGEVTRGPLTVGELESLVCLGQLTPETLIRREDEPALVPVRSTALRMRLFPKQVARAAPAGAEGSGATERDADLDGVAPERFQVSRRGRGFWILLVIGNALLLGGGIALQSLTSLVFALGGMGLFTFGLLWSL